MGTDPVRVLEEATDLGEIIAVVKNDGAIAEVMGDLRLRRGEEWLTLGQEGGSHVHLRAAEVRAARFAHPEERNAALQFLGADGALLLQLSFRGTNPGRAETFDAARLEAVRTRFGALAAPRGEEGE